MENKYVWTIAEDLPDGGRIICESHRARLIGAGVPAADFRAIPQAISECAYCHAESEKPAPCKAHGLLACPEPGCRLLR